mgnify:CR=1 FL=1
MSTLLIKNARYIVSCDDTDRLYERSNLFIRDNAIEYIGPELRQADQVIDASRMVVYPGLINTHHHLYQLFSRNLPEVQRMELFPWLVTLYDVWKNLDEEVVATSSLVGMAELLKTGCTTCFDHHYVFPARAGDLIGAQFRAAELVGMRFHAVAPWISPGRTAACRRTAWYRPSTRFWPTRSGWCGCGTTRPASPCAR